MKKNSVVLVCGNFNVLHPGHLRLLRFAKEQGENLIVAVYSDKIAGASAYVPEQLRLEGIRSNNLVTDSFIIDETASQAIKRLRPDIVVKGKEHENLDNPEIYELQQYGGRLVFSSGETIFSSLDIINKEFQSINKKTIHLPESYLSRHCISPTRLADIVKDFSSLKVCVIGDLIIDEYITCEPLGMSQEDPTIVVTPINTIRFIGGAGIVAAHAAGLGAHVNFISVVGDDECGEYAMQEMRKLGVKSHLMVDDSRPTTLKQRYRSKGKSLLRVSKLHQGLISSDIQKRIIDNLEKIIINLDLLIFSDFNYGCLPQDMIDKIISFAHKHNVFVAADSQSSSQIGDIGRYKGVNLITPTEREARISTKNRDSGIIVLAEELRYLTGASNVFLKMGEEGFIIHAPNNLDAWVTDRIEALNSSPKDVAGAGDSLLTAVSMALVSGATVWEAGCLGALAAALQVSRVGNTPLDVTELLEQFRN
jgi:rfaE bifunctional protein kinase chain/domain